MSSWLEATSLYKVDDKQFLNKSLDKILAVTERKTHSSQKHSYSLRYFLSKQIVTKVILSWNYYFYWETLNFALLICPEILEGN